jgi:hypothetical protein
MQRKERWVLGGFLYFTANKCSDEIIKDIPFTGTTN